MSKFKLHGGVALLLSYDADPRNLHEHYDFIYSDRFNDIVKSLSNKDFTISH